MKIIVAKIKKIKIAIVKNNIAIRIAGKVSRYIDASMNRATPTRGRLSGRFSPSSRHVNTTRTRSCRTLSPSTSFASPAHLAAGLAPRPSRPGDML